MDASEKDKSKCFIIFKKTLWLIGTSRNAILVIACGFIGYIFQMNGDSPFVLVGYVPPGLPEVKPPPFSATVNNETVNFVGMVSNLGTGIMVLPLLTILENIAICKAFGKSVILECF